MVGYSFLGSISFGVFYSFMENYSPFTVDLSNNLFIAAVVGGALAGIGLGFILRFGGATGGDDILTIVLSKRTRFYNWANFSSSLTRLFLRFHYII